MEQPGNPGQEPHWLEAGGYLIYSGVRNGAPKQFEIKRSITVNKPAEELYQFWRNLENLPSFMEHLESVTQREGVSHWVVEDAFNRKVEWDARVSQEHPNELIRWHSLPGSPVDHRGSVQFAKATGNRGTVVTVTLQYGTPAGKAGNIVSALFGKHPEQIVREELRHFKQLMEGNSNHTRSTGRSTRAQRLCHGEDAGRTSSQMPQEEVETGRGKKASQRQEDVARETSTTETREPVAFRRVRA